MTNTIAPTGDLSWGVKDSLRSYLSRQADFSLNVEDGASVGAGNVICFRLAGVPGEDAVWTGRGHAVLRAHGGMMRLSLKNPVVRRSGADLVLAFDFGSEQAGAAPDYFEVARLEEVPGEAPEQRTYRTFLLPDATGMFNDMYEADSELDVVTVTIGKNS